MNSNTNVTTDMNSTSDNTVTTSVSTGSYPAYGTVAVDVPTTVRYSFQKDYPMVSSAQWYLTPNGQSLTPDDIVSRAKSMFGLTVYDINRVRAANMDYVYHVRLLDNGQVRSVWLNEQGTEVAAADVFRSPDTNKDIITEVNTATSNDTNAAKDNTNDKDTKIKMKTSDGTKIKAEDGEIKVK